MKTDGLFLQNLQPHSLLVGKFCKEAKVFMTCLLFSVSKEHQRSECTLVRRIPFLLCIRA